MNLTLPRRALVGSSLFLVVSLLLLGIMLVRLGAVPVPLGGTGTVRALLGDAEGLPVQADVLVHGVRVGSVRGIASRSRGTLVTLALDRGLHLHADATVRVGFKTPLGEPFLDLDPGHRAGPPPALLRYRPTVQIDDALAFLDAAGRANARAITLALGRGAASPAAAAQTAAALRGVESATASLGGLTAQLRAQRRELTGVVTDGRIVLDALAGRGGALRSITRDARRTLGALAVQRGALGATLARLPGLLHRTRVTLTRAEPLIGQALPLTRGLEQAAPALSRALGSLPPVSADLASVLTQAPALRASLLPALAELGATLAPTSAALERIGPALADFVPVARYLGPRGRTAAAWFANTADLGSHGDAKGDWARFFVLFDRATLFGTPSGAPPRNAYTAPGDAAHNQAYRAGGFPRLEPYLPALASARDRAAQ